MHDTPLGRIHADRQLDAAQLQLVVAALQLMGWEPRLVVEVELTEAGATAVGFETDDDGRVRADRQRVRRVRFGARGPSIVDSTSIPMP